MAKQTINDGEKGGVVRSKLNDNFTELYNKDSLQDTEIAGKSDAGHTHPDYEPADPLIQQHIQSPHDYEPADPAIQNHLATPHAPSNANYYEHPATHPLSIISDAGTAASKNVGTGPFEVVQVDADGKLPAIDGSKLLNVAALTPDQQAAVDGANAPSATNVFATMGDVGSGGGGGMDPLVYDPNTIEADVFDMDNMVDGTNKVAMTTQERTDISTNNTKVGITTAQAIIVDNADQHMSNTNNPHSVTQAQVGLDQVDNTSDADKPVSTAQQTALDGKSNTTHDHAGVYEPANANIQGHITDPHHAALDAQVNADITKEEIENKLIGDNITSHRHEHRTNLSGDPANAASSFSRRDHTIDEATNANNWNEEGIVFTQSSTNRSAQIKATVDPIRNIPRLLVRTSGLGPEAAISDDFLDITDSYALPDSSLWTTIGNWSGCGLTTGGLRALPVANEDPGFYSKFFWTEDMNIDVQFRMRITHLTDNSDGYHGLIWDTAELTRTPYSTTRDYAASIRTFDNDFTSTISLASNSSTSANIYNQFATTDTWVWMRFTRTVLSPNNYEYTIYYSLNGTDWTSALFRSGVTWMGNSPNSSKMFFKFQTYYYSSTSRTQAYFKDFVDNLGNATFSEDTAWTSWGGDANSLISYDVANITPSSLPTAYPLGLSISNFDDSTLGWPTWSGAIITQKDSDSKINQICQGSSNDTLYTRNYETHFQSPIEDYTDIDFSTMTELNTKDWNTSYTVLGSKYWIENGWLHMARQPSFQYSSSSFRNELGLNYVPGYGENWSIESQFDMNQFDFNINDNSYEAFYLFGVSRDSSLFEESGSAYYRAVFRMNLSNMSLEFTVDDSVKGSVANFNTIKSGYFKVYRSGSTLYGQYKQKESDAWTTIGSGAESYTDHGCRFWFGFVGNYTYGRNINRSIVKYKYFKLTNASTTGPVIAGSWSSWKKHISYNQSNASDGDTLIYDGNEFKPEAVGSYYTKNEVLDQNNILTIEHKSDPNIERSIKILEKQTGAASQTFSDIDFIDISKYNQSSLYYPITSDAVQESSGDITITSSSYGWYPPGLTYVAAFDFSAYNPDYIYGTYLDDSGTHLYACHNIQSIGQWTLSTPFDLTTATYDGTGLFDAVSTTHGVNNIWFKPDGTKCYTIRADSYHLDEWDLTTPWNIVGGVTIVNESSFDTVWEANSYQTNLCISPDGLHLYLKSGYYEARYYQFGTAWDVSTLAFVYQLDADDALINLPYNCYAVGIDPDGDYFYTATNYTSIAYDGIFRWKLNTKFDLSSIASMNSYERFDWEDTVPGNFPYNLGACWTPNGKYFLSSNSAADGKLYSMFNSGYKINVPHIITTKNLTSFPIQTASIINSVAITSTIPANTEIYVLVSFDGRKTWSAFKNSTWLNVVEIERYIHTAGNTISEMQTALTAFTVTDEQSLDFAFGLISIDGTSTPTLSSVVINYDEDDVFTVALDSDYQVKTTSSSTSIKKLSAGLNNVKATINIGSGESLSPNVSSDGTEVTKAAVENVLTGDIISHDHTRYENITNAVDINIADSADNFISTEVEGALEELAAASGTGVPTTAGVVYHGDTDPESVADINLHTSARTATYNITGTTQTRVYFPASAFAADTTGDLVIDFYGGTDGVIISHVGCACPLSPTTEGYEIDNTRTIVNNITFGGAVTKLTSAGVAFSTDHIVFPEILSTTGLIVTFYVDNTFQSYRDGSSGGFTYWSNTQTDIDQTFTQSSSYGDPMGVDKVVRADFIIGQNNDIFINNTSDEVFMKLTDVWGSIGVIGSAPNILSASNPTISTDPDRIGATLTNTTSGEMFVCTDNTAGANVWKGQLGTNVP